MNFKPKQISLRLPFNIGGVDFIADESQQRAAWAMYVEMVTRVAVQPLRDNDHDDFADDEGILREALNSLYTVFGIIRDTIREAGPEISDGPESLGPIAIEVLNQGLRPFLSKWHPMLSDWEAQRDPKTGIAEHEKNWEHYAAMRKHLRALQADLSQYVKMLAVIAGAEPESKLQEGDTKPD